MEIAVVGDDLFTIGFRLVGIEKWFNVSGDVSVDEAVKSALSDKGIGVIVKNNRIHEIDSSIILQPGPACLTDGLKVIESLIREQ